MQSEKSAIRAAFGRAASTYDGVAGAQRHIAQRLLERTELESINVALDAGCGTGYGTRKLAAGLATNNAFVQCVALDLATEMVATATMHATIKPVGGDIETLPFGDSSIDLYWSSLAWQWTDVQLAILEAARVLKPGGKLRVATLGENTLHELRSAFLFVDDATHVRDFPSAQALRNSLHNAGFISIEIFREAVPFFGANVLSLLNEIKALGAHVIGKTRRRGLLGRDAWQQVQARYEALRTPQGLPATYDVIYLCASKAA